MRVLLLGILLAGCVSLPSSENAEVILGAVDEQQRRMVAVAEAPGLERLALPNLRINAPTGRVIGREQFLAMMRSGQIGAERFRTFEAVNALRSLRRGLTCSDCDHASSRN